ncbi:YwiC-like family protein [Ornithinimicrobium sp. LYQ121]|uniref:YwiC-like family protein n=1 Tax=Ornithinimicrobium sp. LYQ121 TaxID=3378801 RepID=UPI003854ABBF
MSTTAPPVQRRPARRRRSPGWVPHQHGAWAMLATPLLVGALASGPRPAHLLLAAFWFAGYLAFFATGLWLKARRRSRYLAPVRAYLLLAAGLGLALLTVSPGLLRWTPLFILPLGVGLVASATRHERALVSGLATSAGSSLMTLVAYDLGGTQDRTRAWLLTAVLACYFVGTVFYVKSAIRERDNTSFLVVSVTYHLLVAALALLLPAPAGPVLATTGFALAARAALLPRLGWSPARLGVGEIGWTLVVASAALLLV